MMGRQKVDQSQLFYLFNLEGRIPARHLLRRINPTVTRILAEFRKQLEPFYSEIGRPSIDPELMIRMLIVGYCYGIRFERKLCEEVELHLIACASGGHSGRRLLSRPRPQGSEARRPAGPVAEQVHAHHQPQGGAGART
jgi:hypothetical protein